MSGYSKFGPSNPLTKEQVDPVQQCVGNTWFTSTGIPAARMQKDFCPRFMAQRCANNWDEYCEAFLLTSNSDMAGNNSVNKDFLTLTANKKYCRIDTDSPGSHCSLKCESFMPEGQSSVNICESIGALNWVDTRDEADLTGNFPQSARLTQLSPLYLNSCPDICDMKGTTINPDALTAHDKVLNKCLENGTCNTVLMDLAYNVVKNNTPVTNPAFKKVIDYAKIDAPINPNNIISVAREFGIPSEIAMEVIEEAKYGNLPYERRTHIENKPFSPIYTEPVIKSIPEPVNKSIPEPDTNCNPEKGVVPSVQASTRRHVREQMSVKNNIPQAYSQSINKHILIIISILVGISALICLIKVLCK